MVFSEEIYEKTVFENFENTTTIIFLFRYYLSDAYHRVRTFLKISNKPFNIQRVSERSPRYHGIRKEM